MSSIGQRRWLRRRFVSNSLLATVAWLLLAGCTLDAVDQATLDVFLPRYRPMASGPLALIDGRLVHDDGCLWVESGGGRHLMLWPSGAFVRDDGVRWTVVNGNYEAVVGRHVSAVGGEYKQGHYDFIVELIGEEVPVACQAAGQYWLGRQIRTAAP